LIDFNFSHNFFVSNKALRSGGAIKWNLLPPLTQNNSFFNNSAPYGDSIASFAARMVLMIYNSSGQNELIYDSSKDIKTLILNDVSSGNEINYLMEIKLLDFDNNIVTLEKG